jgi:hypothetical protein
MKDYHFDDFTEKDFRRLVQLAKTKYPFATYDQVNPSEGNRFILWRHDIDFSVHRAHALAKIEQEEGITATYLVWLGSEFYNVFEEETRETLKDIPRMGHTIGLHFNTPAYDIKSQEDLIKALSFEKEILENLLDIEIKVFSFHRPMPEILKYNRFKYAGMVNTYAEYFQEQVGYCSDSNGYWRHRRLQEVLEKAGEEQLQVLTHPVWWQPTVMAPKERVWSCIDHRADRNKETYQTRLKLMDRENVDWRRVVNENKRRIGPLKKDEKKEDLLKLMNEILRKNHRELVLDIKQVNRFPFLFVFGLPRSGTTLLMQLMTNCLNVGYIDNLIARLWSAPLYGILLSKILSDNNKEQDYASSWGKTKGISGPHEFSYFWLEWFKPDAATDGIDIHDILKKTDWDGLKEILLNMAHYFNKPMAFKGMWPAYFLEKLTQILPNSLFIYISRKEEDVAMSLYHARLKYYKDPNVWWSMRPPEYETLKNLPWHQQIAGQIVCLTDYYLQQMEKVEPKHTISIAYEDLCQSPQKILEAIQNKVKKEFSYPIAVIKKPPKTFDVSTYESMSSMAEYKRLKEALEKFKEK